MSSRPNTACGITVLAFVALLGVGGCGPAGPKTYPVQGKFEVAGGDAAHLAGATVEAAEVTDPSIRAAGTIQSDGSFTLETLHAGVIKKGAQEGNYKVRIILGDDGDKEARRLRRAAVHNRFLDFETSKLSFQVPTSGDVTLKVAPR